MRNSINVYWSILDYSHPSLHLLASKPESVILEVIRNNQYPSYIKCPAFSKEFKNTFSYKAFYDFTIDINPKDLKPTNKNTPLINLGLRDIESKHFYLDPHIIFFSDKSLEMSEIPCSLHTNNFTNSANIFPGRYDIGKWFRPLNIDFLLKTPKVEVKKGDALFYLKFNTDKKINFINFAWNEKIAKIANACLNLKFIQPAYSFKTIYNLFLKSGYQKQLLKEIQATLVK